MNSRLDTIQAAILIQKIKILDKEIIKRNNIADNYSNKLSSSSYVIPKKSKKQCFAWAQYTLRHKERDRIIGYLKLKGVPSAIYYPIPLNKQSAYKNSIVVSSGLKNTVKFCKEVFSIPMSPYLQEEHQEYIIECLLNY
jgi:dTDP-4-amino-4,6-dideoxygalactose transaminase